jgi:tetratricopeptide (TPR) repeat protein
MTSATLPGSQSAGALRDLIFISYCHSDEDWLGRLLIFLKPYTRRNLKVWADPYIKAGDKWRRNISEALSRTCVAVLLVSPDFLASDFICDEELPPLLQGVDDGSITLFPIPISYSDPEASPLAQYQFSHPPDDPLDRMRRPDRNPVFVRIVKQIVAVAQKGAPGTVPVPTVPSRRIAVAPVAATGGAAALHGVPPQRPNYLRRQEYLDRLKRTVLGVADRAVGITGAMPQGGRVGLHGTREPMGSPISLIGLAYLFKRCFEEATAKLLLAIQDHPGFPLSYRHLAVCYAHMGRLDEARAAIAKLHAITPVVVPSNMPFRDPEDRELYLSGLRMAAGEVT